MTCLTLTCVTLMLAVVALAKPRGQHSNGVYDNNPNTSGYTNLDMFRNLLVKMGIDPDARAEENVVKPALKQAEGSMQALLTVNSRPGVEAAFSSDKQISHWKDTRSDRQVVMVQIRGHAPDAAERKYASAPVWSDNAKKTHASVPARSDKTNSLFDEAERPSANQPRLDNHREGLRAQDKHHMNTIVNAIGKRREQQLEYTKHLTRELSRRLKEKPKDSPTTKAPIRVKRTTPRTTTKSATIPRTTSPTTTTTTPSPTTTTPLPTTTTTTPLPTTTTTTPLPTTTRRRRRIDYKRKKIQLRNQILTDYDVMINGRKKRALRNSGLTKTSDSDNDSERRSRRMRRRQGRNGGDAMNDLNIKPVYSKLNNAVLVKSPQLPYMNLSFDVDNMQITDDCVRVVFKPSVSRNPDNIPAGDKCRKKVTARYTFLKDGTRCTIIMVRLSCRQSGSKVGVL